MARKGPVELAVWRLLRDAPAVHVAHEGLDAIALVLARKLDEGAGLATAAVARELRSTLTVLTKVEAGDDDGFDEIAARLSSAVGVPS